MAVRVGFGEPQTPRSSGPTLSMARIGMMQQDGVRSKGHEPSVWLTELVSGTLLPAGFVSRRAGRTWHRETEQLGHVVALLERRGTVDVQWGITCPEVARVLWEHVPESATPDVSYAVVSGTPGSVSHPARAQSFTLAEIETHLKSLADGIQTDMSAVVPFLDRFSTRESLATYLLENRDRTDRREFVIPAKLPLKLFTAAALLFVDSAPDACDLVAEAEAELARFTGTITAGRLQRLRAAAEEQCG